VYFSISST